jgi:hypothetical protein
MNNVPENKWENEDVEEQLLINNGRITMVFASYHGGGGVFEQ